MRTSLKLFFTYTCFNFPSKPCILYSLGIFFSASVTSFITVVTRQGHKIYSVVTQRETEASSCLDYVNFNPNYKTLEGADHTVTAMAGFLSRFTRYKPTKHLGANSLIITTA